jgi:hypothetical protein
VKVSLHKHEHIEAPVREGGPFGSEDRLPRESESFYPLLKFENDDSRLAVKMVFR